MKGSEWLRTIPDALTEAQEYIVDAVDRNLHLKPPVMTMSTQWRGHKGTLYVMAQPLVIGEVEDYVIVNVDAKTAQRIADMLYLVLPTTKVIDLLHEQAIQRQRPHIQPSDPNDRVNQGYSPSMADKSAMYRHSEDIQGAIDMMYPGLADNCGKHWVLTNLLVGKNTKAANYGWYDDHNAPYVSASGFRMWQTLGTRHSWTHVDYSQVLQALDEYMLVDGQLRKVLDVASDPELFGLVSSEGPLKFGRYPITGIGPVDPPGTEKPDELVYERTLRLMKPRMTGPDVFDWQDFLFWMGYDLGPYGPLGNGVDGSFGGLTDGATRQFQGNHRDPETGSPLVQDGLVGPATIRAANYWIENPDPTEPDPEQPLISSFMEAVNYNEISGDRGIKWIVIHTAEAAEKPTTAEALGQWVSGPHAPRASWHYSVDSNSIVQSVLDENVAWHAPGANRHGIGIEHAGYARQNLQAWFDEFSMEMLRLSAKLTAHLCRKHNIPVQFVDEEGLKNGTLGITTHYAVTMAFRKSDHTDPGREFPMNWYLERVQEELDETKAI